MWWSAIFHRNAGLGEGSRVFWRRWARKKNGKRHTYWVLVEAIRTGRGSRQRVVAYLGELRRSERNGWAPDRGMVSEENRKFLRERGGSYLVGTPQALLRQFERYLTNRDGHEVQAGVEVKLVPEDAGQGRAWRPSASALRVPSGDKLGAQPWPASAGRPLPPALAGGSRVALILSLSEPAFSRLLRSGPFTKPG